MAVVIYTTPSCTYCNMAKKYLREHGVSFIEYNVVKDTSKADEMMRKSGQMGVPVIDINGKIILGFNKGEIDKVLKQ